MKKYKNTYDIKDFEFKLFLSLVSGSILLTGFKIYDKDKDNSQGEINLISSYKDLNIDDKKIDTNQYNQTYTYKELIPQSSEYYRSIEIDGRIVNFENTPTPTPAPNYELIDAYTDEMIIGEDGVYPEGYFEYLDIKEHSLKFETKEEMISFYSKVFELNEDVSTNVINGIIGNKNYSLEGEVIINDTTYNSLEEGISRILHDVSSSPSDYGYSEDEVRSQSGYQLDFYYAEELIYKFSNVLDVNPYIAEAIAYGECGRGLNSTAFVYYHNPGGIMSNGGLAKYRNEAAGMYEFVKLLHDRYYVRGDDDYNRIRNMSNGYCEDPAYWRNLVGSIYYDLCENGYGSTFYKYRNPSRDLIYCDEQQPSFYNSKYYTLKKDEN